MDLALDTCRGSRARKFLQQSESGFGYSELSRSCNVTNFILFRDTRPAAPRLGSASGTLFSLSPNSV